MRTLISKDNKTKCSQSFQINNETVTDNKLISNEFCNYFSNIGRLQTSNIPNLGNKYQSYLSELEPKSMLLSPTDPNEIISILRSLKSKTSQGQDGVSTQLLQQLENQLNVSISILINKSRESGTVPDIMKIAKIVPIYKNQGQNLIKKMQANITPSKFIKSVRTGCSQPGYAFLNDTSKLNAHRFGFRKKTLYN